MQKMHICYKIHKATFLKNKKMPNLSLRKFVDSEFMAIFASDNYMLNS